MAKKNEQQIAKRKAIYDLQNMLYTISRFEKGSPDVIPDGIFGIKTAQAVSKFQENVGMTANGVVDYETWSAISARYREVVNNSKSANKIGVFSNTNGVLLKRGDKHDAVYMVQLLFQRMSAEFADYQNGEISGILDEITERNIMLFQKANRIEPHGLLDRQTWDRIALYYNLFYA